MIVKGTSDFIRLLMLKNHVGYLDSDGWNEIVYDELSRDDRELVIDLTPVYDYLFEYVAEPIMNDLDSRKAVGIEHLVYFGVDMDTEELFMELHMLDDSRKRIVLA